MSKNLHNRTKRRPIEKVFIVNESYVGNKNLSDIFADLLYSTYCNQESAATGNKYDLDGHKPDRTGQARYGSSA